MARVKRITGLLLILVLILQQGIYNVVLASEEHLQTAPAMVRVEQRNVDEPPIGYNEFDTYYADFKWNVSFPPDASAGFLNIYLQEITKPYRPPRTRTLKERDLPGSLTSFRLKELNSGTIYYVDMTAYHTYVIDSTTYRSPESIPSNKVKVLTDISINAYSYGTNKIKIEWDDVWNSSRRIDYKLYISENSSFTNTPPIYIGQSQIGQDKPVTVNEATGKLEYVHTVRDSGRVYYVRIEPDVAEDELKRTQFSKTVSVSSFILVRTTKISTSDSGVIWKLEWSPVVTGLSDSSIRIVYHVYRGVIGSNDLPQYMAAVDGTNFFITLPPGEIQNYFIIRAIVTRDGQEVYRGVRIESDRIIVGEQEVPSRPAAPELAGKFERVEGDPIISYDSELKPNSATVLWRVPTKGDGQIDNDVAYDIWLLNDPDLIDNPPSGTKIASDVRMGSSNFILNGNTLVGYKYTVSNLTANSTYYLKIVAKKQFIEYVDDILQNVTYNSDPAIKVIITPARGPIDQPRVPARPPLKVKKTAQGKDMITRNTVTIQLKNLWYEQYNFAANRWEYIRSEKLDENDIPPFDPLTTVVDDVYYRKVAYDSGVTIDVGCVRFIEGMSYEEINTITADSITNFPVAANDPLEDSRLNPDRMKHNIDITLTNLEPNTVYIIWVRASRQSVNLTSGPSDPIIITTSPIVTAPIEKPVVPAFNYNLPSDTHIDVGWEYNTKYNYYLKYGLEDNIDAAVGDARITPEDLYESVYYRVKDLNPDTLYYFWIQAESVNEAGQTSRSEWSDAYPVRTLPYIPPDTPKGFGIKNSSDAITKNSITFEWIQEENVEYILEIASNIDYKDAKEYEVGMGSEFKVNGLLSNHRYYARLYGYDSLKDLRSEPTQSITVRTKRSSDDYDSDQDIESVITGEYIEKGTVITGGIWDIRIVGVNADRFVEYALNDKELDYKIDLKKPPSAYNKAKILVSDKVFKALTGLKENLIIETDKTSIVIRPGVLTSETGNPLAGKPNGVDYEISISYPKDTNTNKKNMVFKTEVTRVEIGAVDGSSLLPINSVLKPIKVVVTYNEGTWYKEGKTSGFIFQEDISSWKRLGTSSVFDPDRNVGTLAFETLKTGDMAVAELGNDYFDDIYYHRYETVINNVASVHELKSVPGRLFEPDMYAKLGDTVKLMLDILDYNYGRDFMNEAAKAGIISYADVSTGSSNCTVGKAYSMLVRVFEIKTGRTLDSQSKSRFIAQNGMTVIKDNGRPASVSDPIKRGEVAALLEKLMVYIGELE